MSNYLAIATVTATLQRILQTSVQVDIAGARVTTARPDASGSSTPEVGVNLFLYQAAPNPAWRNADLHTRRPKGDLVKHTQAGINLFYLMTFYGNEVELEPQRLMGSTIRTLVDQPILTPEMIRETVNHATFSYLQESTLAEQVERVTLVPTPMTTEELSKIWSVFFQTPYTLSFAYQGSTVLIEGDKPARRMLPLRSCQFFTTPNQPLIDQITSDAGANQPITLSHSLTLQGRHLVADHPQILAGDRPQIRLGDAKVTPQEISASQIKLKLAEMSEAERAWLRAGVQSLQVLHPLTKRIPAEPDRAVGSNIVAFVLCPTITEVTCTNAQTNEDDLYNAEIVVRTDLVIGAAQRLFLLLNELQTNHPAAYVFKATSRTADHTEVEFNVKDIKAGTYLVRIQIDSAESPLTVDLEASSPTFDQYIGPTVAIP
jgi:hypothetical protein